MRSLRERCLGGISDSRREKEKENQQAKRAVTNEVASNPFEKVALTANMANEYQDPYDQAYWGEGTGKKGKKGKSKFQFPYDGDKGYPSYDNGRGKGGQEKGKSQTLRRRRSSPSFSRLHHPQSLPMPVGQIKIGIHPGIGVNKAGTHPMRNPAQDKR